MKKEWWKMIKYPIYVTIDTNILDAANFDFNEKSTLQLLVNYVKKGKVKVVLSNIVVKEAEKHIAKRGVTEELKFPGTLRNQSTKWIVILNKKYEKIWKIGSLFAKKELLLLGFKPVQHSGVSQKRNGTLMNK